MLTGLLQVCRMLHRSSALLADMLLMQRAPATWLCLQHLGPEHEDPSSLECARSLIQIGDANWLAYHSPDVHPLPRGHLLSFPNIVGADGSISALPDCDEVPDLGGKILGTKSVVLPGLLTA